MNTEEFAARVAAPLKAPVTLDEEFTARVMRAVDEASRPFWARRTTVTVSPLGGLALAAGIAGLVVFGALGAVRTFGGAPAVVGVTDTIHVIRFVFVEPSARTVAIAGDFNGWVPSGVPLERSGVDGTWTVALPMTPGRHEYAFVVDGERWVADPTATTQVDEFGIESSVVRVGDVTRGG